MLSRRAAKFRSEVSGPPIDPREEIRYVDPDATGANTGLTWEDAYTSLSSWNSAESKDLVTPDIWHHVYVRSSAGTADTTKVSIDGWTTAVTNFIRIEAASGDEALKTGWDNSRYRLAATDSGWTGVLRIVEDFVEVIGVQIQYVFSSDNNRTVVRIEALSANARLLFDGARIAVSGGSHNGMQIISSVDPSSEITVQNTIIEPTANGFILDGGIGDLYQTVIRNNGGIYGVLVSSGTTFRAINSAVFNSSNNFDVSGGATSTISNCASDDGDGINPVSPDSGDWSREFIDPANSDFTLINGRNLHLGGTPITGGPLTDIDGDPWNATTPSIGIDEYV